MDSISFTCHIFGKLNRENEQATITKILGLLSKGDYELEVPDIFCSEEPIIIVRQKNDLS